MSAERPGNLSAVIDRRYRKGEEKFGAKIVCA